VSDPPRPSRVLGIDPGTRLVGWGVVEGRGNHLRCVAHGALRADPSQPIDRRLRALAEGLRQVVRTHRPDEAAVEEAFYGRDARAAQRIGEGRGALILVLAEAGLPVAHYPNNVVKKAVTGVGRASKPQVQAMVRRVLALAEAPAGSDAADALALAVCHLQRKGLPGGPAGGVSPRIAAAIQRARGGRRGPRRG
jgi:crossover junction endodeoxyribonuclease RuvC